MYRMIVHRLPASILSAEELRNAESVFQGTSGEVKNNYSQGRYPRLVGGAPVESPSGEILQYLSLLKWDPETESWRPTLEDPRDE
jgi:hypothetical protein